VRAAGDRGYDAGHVLGHEVQRHSDAHEIERAREAPGDEQVCPMIDALLDQVPGDPIRLTGR
jgi:hypothetical protein